MLISLVLAIFGAFGENPDPIYVELSSSCEEFMAAEDLHGQCFQQAGDDVDAQSQCDTLYGAHRLDDLEPKFRQCLKEDIAQKTKEQAMMTLEIECLNAGGSEVRIDQSDDSVFDPAEDLKYQCVCPSSSPQQLVHANENGQFDCQHPSKAQVEGETDNSSGKESSESQQAREDDRKEEEEKADSEDPSDLFNCAGGASGQAAQQVQQQLQQRAQMENQCRQNFEQTRVSCDPDSVVGVRGMLDEAMAKADRVRNTEKKGLKKACEEYEQAFQRASSELKNFRSSCSNAKANCLGTCQQAIVQSESINPAMAMVAACVPMLGPIADSMRAAAMRIENVEIRNCRSFETILSEADQQHQQLVDSIRTADLCQSEIVEDCTTNPNGENCRKIETAARETKVLNQVDTQLERKREGIDFDGASVGGPGAASINPVEGQQRAQVRTPRGSTSANIGNSNPTSATAAPRSRGTRGNFGSQYDEVHQRLSAGGFERARRSAGATVAVTNNVRQRHFEFRQRLLREAENQPKRIRLKRYIASPDEWVDGITSASGPGLFEKVSNRYRVELKKKTLY